MGVGVGSDGDEPGRRRVGEPGPAGGWRPPRERRTGVDEVGGGVQRGRQVVFDERGDDVVAEVVGAVVERDHHAALVRGTAGGCVGGGAEDRDGVVERHHGVVLAEVLELGPEGVDVEVDFAAGAVVEAVALEKSVKNVARKMDDLLVRACRLKIAH